MAKSQGKAKRGQPTKYDPIYCEMLRTHMAEGLSYESFAGLIGVNRDTLYAWEHAHKNFSDAKSHGREAERLWWEKSGRDGLYNETIKDAEGMTVTRSINASIWIFNAKNRLGWRDKQEIETRDPATEELSKEVELLTEELRKLTSSGAL